MSQTEIYADIVVTGRKLTLSRSTLERNPNLGAGVGAEKELRSLPVRRDGGNTGQVSDGQVAACKNPSQQSSNARHARPSRIRQSSKPLMNKLETEWFNIISVQYPNYPRPRAQARRYRLGNGIWFKVDFSVSIWPNRNPDDTVRGPDMETCWEVKGPHAFRGGFENLKVAAGLWTEVRWVLAWKQDGEWKEQEVLP
jgi:hypothetical protein